MAENDLLITEIVRILQKVPGSYDDFVRFGLRMATKTGREHEIIDFAKKNKDATTSDYIEDLFLDMSKQVENKYSK